MADTGAAAREQQIKQMCDFILQEAKEKANEIHMKTENDSNLEKQMKVHNAKNKIQKEFKEKEKQFRTQKRIAITREEAKLRVKKMEIREKLLDDVKAKAYKQLESITSGPQYKDMLRDLIVQGLIKMNETKVDVIVRECDKTVVESIVDEAAKKYQDILKKEAGESVSVSLTVNPNGDSLPPPPSSDPNAKSCVGGVVLKALMGRVSLDNTLDSRLENSFGDLMPEVRSTLFSIRV